MTIPAWTYSQLSTFETCPKKFYHARVAKDFPEPPTEATIWGEKVHTAMEHRILNKTPLPEGMSQWENIAKKIDNLRGEKFCEIQMAVDKNFQPAPWGNAWSRGIADVVVKHDDRVAILDHKTGKRKPTEQLMLYAGYAFATYPEVNVVSTGFIWLKEKKIDSQVFTRREVPMIWQEFVPRVAKLERAYETGKWIERPSGLCNGWCAVKSCKFYKDKR